MSSLITETIREILMEEQQVCIPEIGTLRLSPQAAVVSPIEGRVTPPSDRATFNSNLVLDDGRILRSLRDIPVLTDSEAEMLLKDFLKNIKENLDAGRSVQLEGIGRLFKHFDGEIRFTAGGENFSKDSFGLPGVDLRPIARTEKQRRIAADPMLAGTGAVAGRTPVTAKTNTPPVKPQSKFQEFVNHPDLRQILWYVFAIMATFAILVLGYQVLKRLSDDSPATPVVRTEKPPVIVEEPPARTPLPPVDASRVVPDEPPRLSDARSTPAQPVPEQPEPNTTGNGVRTEDNQATGSDNPVTTQPINTAPEPEPEPAPTDAANGGATYNTAFIAIGLYGSAANVTKNENRIRRAGYDAQSRREGRYTRVGVRVQYTTEEDMMETLRAIQRDYDDAFVMEVNGRKVRIE